MHILALVSNGGSREVDEIVKIREKLVCPDVWFENFLRLESELEVSLNKGQVDK